MRVMDLSVRRELGRFRVCRTGPYRLRDVQTGLSDSAGSEKAPAVKADVEPGRGLAFDLSHPRRSAMPNTRDPGGQQPEARASLEDAARSGSKKAENQGLRAKPETAPEPRSLDSEEAEAARILARNAGKDAGTP